MSDRFEIKIDEPDAKAMERAKACWHGVCKPLGSLGMLEELVIKIAGIQGTEQVHIGKRCALVVCADNGVVAEGVSQTGSEVTAIVAKEIADGKSNINIMADAARADTIVVDVGMNEKLEHANLISRRIGDGTANIAKGPAMTRQQAIQCLHTGISLVKEMKEQGYELIVTGEMGIGNTTTSSALAAVLLDESVENVTGRGAGLSDEGLTRKKAVIEQAIKINQPDKTDPIGVLSKLGGFDIAVMTGIFLGGGAYHVPIVLDGVISAVAAAYAYEMNPVVKEYMIPSHVSKEQASGKLLSYMGLEAIIHAGMHLGEGTGGVCLLPLLDIALAEYTLAHKFEETEVEQYETFDEA